MNCRDVYPPGPSRILSSTEEKDKRGTGEEAVTEGRQTDKVR